MALDDVQHVEAVAIIRALAGDDEAERAVARGVALRWVEDHRPEQQAYMAAMSALVERGKGRAHG